MADKLTAAQLAELGQRNIRVITTRTATIDNDSISATDITDRIKKWGSTKFEVYNKHPNERGAFRFPVVTLEADNSGGYFSIGGTIFPNGRPDLFTTTLRFQESLVFSDGSTANVLDFTGQLREPEYDETEKVNLIAEHPLTVLTGRKWTRYDRIGGDTGIDFFFNS